MLKWIEREELKQQLEEKQWREEMKNAGSLHRNRSSSQLPCLTTQLDKTQRVTRRLRGLQAEPAFRFGFTGFRLLD